MKKDRAVKHAWQGSDLCRMKETVMYITKRKKLKNF